MTEAATRHPGSFRDPKGHVFSLGEKIFRTITLDGAAGYELARDSGLLHDLEVRGWLVPGQEIDRDAARAIGLEARHVLRHPRLPFIAYPYEWSFLALRDAALLHLDLILHCVDRGVALSDATAYNIQYNGHRPQFIDVLSLQPYTEGAPWQGYRQFCEQFLNPLLLTALFGVPHHAWYRGSLEGIPTTQLAPMLGLRHRFDYRLLTHVILQARLQRQSVGDPSRAGASARRVRLSKNGYRAIVTQLRSWIAGLAPAGTHKTAWSDYADANTYSDAEAAAKHAAVAAYCESRRPGVIWDIGCNTGAYSETALKAGAGFSVGFDADPRALDKAYSRARDKRLAFLPLYQDLANPSPDQGWGARERSGMHHRTGADAILALAIIHHLAIGRNVPLPDVVHWLVQLAPSGIIEFVPKSDPTVRTMLTLREDIFSSYSEDVFANALQQKARIVEKKILTSTGRALYFYEK